jgi:hypothetical protein
MGITRIVIRLSAGEELLKVLGSIYQAGYTGEYYL